MDVIVFCILLHKKVSKTQRPVTNVVAFEIFSFHGHANKTIKLPVVIVYSEKYTAGNVGPFTPIVDSGQKGEGEVDAPIIYTVTIVKKDVIMQVLLKACVMVTDVKFTISPQDTVISRIKHYRGSFVISCKIILIVSTIIGQSMVHNKCINFII